METAANWRSQPPTASRTARTRPRSATSAPYRRRLADQIANAALQLLELAACGIRFGFGMRERRFELSGTRVECCNVRLQLRMPCALALGIDEARAKLLEEIFGRASGGRLRHHRCSRDRPWRRSDGASARDRSRRDI